MKSIEKTKLREKILKCIYYGVPFLFVVLLVPTIFSNSVWTDETFSLELSRKSLAELIRLDAMDVHPPLYYIILKIGMKIFGMVFAYNYAWIGKFVSVIPYIILIIIGYTFIQNRYGRQTAFLFNLFIMTMPHMMHYAIEIRMYSWGMLFVTCAFLMAMDIISTDYYSRKKWIMLTLFSVLAAYTHYFACVAAIVIYAEIIIVMIKRKNIKAIRNAIISGICVAILYIPWLIVFIKQLSNVSENYWISPITYETIKGYILYVVEMPYEALVKITKIAVLLGIAGTIASVFKKKSNAGVCGIIVLIATVAIGVILSYAIRPIFVSRYMMSAIGCFWFGVAYGIINIDKKVIKSIAVILICITIPFTYGDFIKEENGSRYATDDLIIGMEHYIGDGATIVTCHKHVQAEMAYQFPNCKNIVVDPNLPDLTRQVYDKCNADNVNDVTQIRKKVKKDEGRVFFIDNNGKFAKLLKENKIKIKYIGTFKLEKYTLGIYEMANKKPKNK